MSRQAVLSWLARHPQSTAEAVSVGVCEQFDAVSVQAIYDILAAFTSAGPLRRIGPAGHRLGSSAEWQTATTTCVGSAAASGMSTARSGSVPAWPPADNHGFRIEEAEVAFWGFCRECTAAGGSPGEALFHKEEPQ